MPGVLPDGEPVPADGSLPPQALAEPELTGTPLAFYIHVPFCASRCGYCDFNTYTASDGVVADGYGDVVLGELALARRVLGDGPPQVDTVFFGGGTPAPPPPAGTGPILGRVGPTLGPAAR